MQYTEKSTIFYVENLSVGYKGKDGKEKLILRDVNFTEKDVVREGYSSTGQKIAFIGRSGRGKSTLFKALTGLLVPSSGQILVSSCSEESPNSAKKVSDGDIGFVDQKYTLFRHKTISQILNYALRKSKLSKIERAAMIKQYLEDWGLWEEKDKYSCELSGGQRQRTAIIEQMLSSKHFMIFDEPASGLDIGNIAKMKQSFQKILDANEYNTIIFSTHDIHLAVELADSIYIIGHPEGVCEYSTIVKHYDLKKMGLAWQDFGTEHYALVDEIKEVLLKS